MKTTDIYNKCIPSCISEIGGTVADVISSIERNYGPVDEGVLFELKVILNEIVLNAVKHGNKGDEKKLIKVHAGLDHRGYALIMVEDEGPGYDYDDIYEKKSVAGKYDVAGCEECGRGIMIINSLCDTVRVNAKGNRITVSKKLTII